MAKGDNGNKNGKNDKKKPSKSMKEKKQAKRDEERAERSSWNRQQIVLDNRAYDNSRHNAVYAALPTRGA